ncbi:protein kinase [Nonomuraea sp. NPDC050556]|uniref:serine/threonine-protein kinase n=1 Tax=Nonomuraea sp. NPDC050556 TaxID=3364369 RepID=UPI00379B3796
MIVERYRLDELIERGPVSEVWRGHDLQADWPIAVKILTAEADDDVRQRFGVLARAVAGVVHPSVVTVFDVGEHDGRPYLVTELLNGPTLAEEIAGRGPMEVPAACELVGKLAAGLDAAHRAGVVHGHLKPQDLRRAGGGALKIVGFGPSAGVAAPTPYTAPEQLDGGEAGPAADLYALGCVCYELLCGRPPFEEPDLADKHLHRPPTWPSQHNSDIPDELERLVLSMLAKDPAARPASAMHVRQALAAVTSPPDTRPQPSVPAAMHTQPAAVSPEQPRVGDTAVFDGLVEEARPAGSSRRVVIQAVAAVAVIVVVTVVLIMLSNRGDKTATPPPATLTPETSAPVASPTPTPSPTPTQPDVQTPTPTERVDLGNEPPGGWRHWLEVFDSSVLSQEKLGGIDPEVAAKAHERIREAGRSLQDGDERGARREISKVMRDLEKARSKNRMNGEGPLIDFLDGKPGAYAR